MYSMFFLCVRIAVFVVVQIVCVYFVNHTHTLTLNIISFTIMVTKRAVHIL